MSAKFSDRHVVMSYSTDSHDFLGGTKNGDVINMKLWDECFFVINKTTGAVGTARIHINASTDITPTSTNGCGTIRYRSCKTSDTNSIMSSWTTATSSGFIMTAGAFECWEVWIRAEDIPSGSNYIWMNSTEIADEELGGAVTAILVGPSYGGEIAPTVLV